MKLPPFSSFNPGPDPQPLSGTQPDHLLPDNAPGTDFDMLTQTIEALAGLAAGGDGGEMKDFEMSCIDYSPRKP